MEWRGELESTCAALGFSDGIKYYKDDECTECVKDLIRFLRRDDSSHVLRRSLGQIGVVQSDLIPLLRDYSNDQELFDLILRLLVNLTGPELLLFREELPEDKVTRNYFIELQRFRQGYKRAFVDEKLWAVFAQSLGKLLKKEYGERSEDDGLVIERILILVRNILQVPRDFQGENRTDDEATIHDQVLWVLHKSGIEDLLLFIASSDEETQYCLHVLEIISLMFREQDPKHLASANFQRSKEEKQQDEQELLKLRMKEMEIQRQRFHQTKSSRHSRFGGTFTLANVKSISEKSMIYHRPLTSMDNIDFHKEKRPKKVARNKRMPGDSEATKRRSTLAIRLFLKEFCVEFLHGAYNNLMSVVRDNLVRHKAQNNDETYYLWAIKFFMEFNREHRFRPDLVIETLNKTCFHFIQSQIETYKDNYEHEKKNRPMCIIWARRMHLAIRAYQELLLNLVSMVSSKDEKIRESGMVLRADVFYEPEYRELCIQQLSLFSPEKMSLSYLKDLVETTHAFLKLMEHMSKSNHFMISSKKVKRKSKPSKPKPTAKVGSDGFLSQRESNEMAWDSLSSELSAILQNASPLPEIVAPFDAASDIPIEEQRSHAMYHIHEALKSKLPGKALALLRASRQVWPENDIFGPQDADNEDEFMAMREILFADIPRPAGLAAGEDSVAVEEGDQGDVDEENFLDRPEIEEEEEDEEAETFVTQRVEQEFDFSMFVQRFGVKSVCSAYAILFANFEKNSDFTNHCVIKMFHRIAFDLKLPALLYHFQILRTFQRIHREYRLNPAHTTMRELNRFAKHILQKFFEVSLTNKHIWMETCFWKTSREASEIIDGYGTQAATKKQKTSYWCEEDEEKLTRVFHQLKEMSQEAGEQGDVLDGITAFFQESGKSRRQVARKLKEMALISDIREVSKKPLKMRAPREWAEEEIEQLTKLFAEFKDAIDPVNRIIESLTVKRPKKRVVEKIMELGLCDDKKKLMKKKVRRALKEGEPGYLQSASESDSALEDSSSEEEDDESHVALNESDYDDFKSVLEDISSDREKYTIAIEWLSNCLNDESEDRESPDDIEDVPIVPLTEECTSAMELSTFGKLLKALEMSAPNDQERYWRIPSTLTAESLSVKASFLRSLLKEDNVQWEEWDVQKLTGKSAPKKKEKRGPNKWMPMRRTVDPEVAQHISKALGDESTPDRAKEEAKKSDNKKGQVRGNVSRDKGEMDDLSHSDSDDSATPVFKSQRLAPRDTSPELSSDDDGDEEAPQKKSACASPSKVESAKRRFRLDSSSSDDGVDDPWPMKRIPSTEKSQSSVLDTSDDEETFVLSKNEKRQTAKDTESSSSDEGVDDPLPVPRVPSDEEASTKSSSRRSRSSSRSSISSSSSRSRSRSSSASSPIRWRSVSNSPAVNRSNIAASSSASNTPKRPRSSPSPKKSIKKARRAVILDSSDDE